MTDVTIDASERPLRYGMSLGGVSGLPAHLDQIAMYEDLGLETAWCSQLFGIDALTLFALGGPATTRIRFGTAVIPIASRHPMVLASQALTSQAATGGRLILGIGSSHRDLVEGALGQSYERPAARLHEFVTTLTRTLDGERFAHHGDFVSVDTTTTFGRVAVPGTDAPPVYVGTMFPRSLRVAAEFAAGVVTWLVGPNTIAEVVAPTLVAASAAVGRDRPTLVAGLPIAVCANSDVDEQEDLINSRLGRFTALPVYEQVLAREHASLPSQLAAVGDEETVAARLASFAAAGVNEINAVCFGDNDTIERTASLLGRLNHDRASVPDATTSDARL